MAKYSEPIKSVSRIKLLTHAVKALTSKRKKSFIVSSKEFDIISAHFHDLICKYYFTDLLSKVDFDAKISKRLLEWKSFFANYCQPKKASELKVLYLAGPNPTNDLDVLLSLGILPFNIWAVEGDKKMYVEAVEDLKNRKIPIKLHYGSLKELFKLYPQTFDIIYIDACSPLITKEAKYNPLHILKEIFINKRLNHLSALITNFSEVKSNENDWAKIFATWYSTRKSGEINDNIENFVGHEDSYKNIEDMVQRIEPSINEYYSDFIRRYIPVFAAEIGPIGQMLTIEQVTTKYFRSSLELNKNIKKIDDVPVEAKDSWEEILRKMPLHLLDLNSYPLLNWVRQVNEHLEGHALKKFINEEPSGNSFNVAVYILALFKSIENKNSAWKTFTSEVISAEVSAIFDSLDFFDREKRLTCDIPMKNLIAELVLGLYSFPCIENASAQLSIKYKAKETWMYSDVFVFDQCRYMYDFLPSLELLKTSFDEIPNQVIIRTCIDIIIRKHQCINNELFWGGSVEGLSTFGYCSLKKRQTLNDKV